MGWVNCIAMKKSKVVLLFPDTLLLSEYLLRNRISQAVVDTREVSLTAHLTENQIAIAEINYQAFVLPVPFT